MSDKRFGDQRECEADDAIADLKRQQDRAFSENEKAVFRTRGNHRFPITNSPRWGDVDPHGLAVEFDLPMDRLSPVSHE